MSKLITNTVRHVDGTADNITLDSSQNVTVEADLTIPDKIIHSGDTNTSIRFPAADTVSAETGGSERLRIDSSGNLLLGTTSVPTSYSSANTLAVIDNSDANAGCIELGGTNNASQYNAGSIHFINNANSNYSTAWDAGSRIVALIRAQLVTSDSNAGDDSGADLVFFRKPEAGSGTEGFRIKSTGDVSLANGNLVVASGHGIDFSATSGSGTSELLDDYEEGTWTVADGSGAGISLTIESGVRYTKIGRLVHVEVDVTVASNSNSTQVRLTHPFAGTNYSGGVVNYTDYNATLVVHASGSGSGMYVFKGVDSSSAFSWSELSNKRIIFALTYTAS